MGKKSKKMSVDAELDLMEEDAAALGLAVKDLASKYGIAEEVAAVVAPQEATGSMGATTRTITANRVANLMNRH